MTEDRLCIELNAIMVKMVVGVLRRPEDSYMWPAISDALTERGETLEQFIEKL